MSYGISDCGSYNWIHQPRGAYGTWIGERPGVDIDYDFEELLNVAVGEQSHRVVVVNEIKEGNGSDGWVTKVTASDEAVLALRRSPRKTMLFMSLTDEQWRMLDSRVRSLGGYANIPSYICAYVGADDFGNYGMTAHSVLEYLIGMMGYIPVIGIPNYYGQQFICRDTETFGDVIKSITDMFDPVITIQGPYFIIESRASWGNMAGSVSVNTARMVKRRRMYRPLPDKFVVEGSSVGEFSPTRYRGKTWVDIQSDTIQMWSRYAGPTGGIVNYTQTWHGRAGDSGGSYEKISSEWMSEENLPGSSVLGYKNKQEERWAKDIFGNLWFSYYTKISQYGYNETSQDWDKLVFEQIEFRYYDQTEYWYMQPRLITKLVNTMGNIWVYEKDIKKAPNHKKMVMKSIYEDPKVPMEFECTIYHYLTAEQAVWLSEKKGRNELEGNLAQESYQRWSWLFTPKANIHQPIPPRFECDVRKMNNDDQLAAGEVDFYLSEYMYRSYTQSNSKHYSVDTIRYYYNEYGLLKREKRSEPNTPGRVPRVKGHRRRMKLESVYGETGNPIMNSPADKIVNKNLVNIDDCDTVLYWRMLLAMSTGRLFYEFVLNGSFYVQRGWGVNLLPVYGAGTDVISVPSTQGRAWIESVQVSEDSNTGEAITILQVEANLS